MKKIPEIRFPEFSGEWVENRLGDVFIIKRGASPRPIQNYLSTKGINWIKIGDVTTDSKYITKTQEKITMNGAEKSVKVYPDDFILSNSMSFGRPYISKIEGCIHDGWLLLRKKIDSINIEYLYYSLLTINIQKKFRAIAAGSTVNNLKADSVKKIKIHIPPTIAEQKKIADFLSSIDEKIEIVSKKIDKLKEYKKVLLQKLLNVKCKNGTCEPELRFKEFSGSWVEKRLGEVATIKNGSSNVEDANENGLYVFFDRSEVIKRSDKYLFDKEALIYAGEGSKFFPKYYKGKFDLHQRAYAIFDFKINGLFLYYLLSLNKYNNHLQKVAVGTTVKSLRLPHLQKIKIHLPPTLAEQEKIAEFLSSVDKKIELEEEKLNKLKEYKKGLLQKMFV